MLLIFLSCAWIAGIYLGTNLNLPPLFYLAGALPLPLLLFYRRRWKIFLTASLGIILLITAALFTYSSLYTVDEGKIKFYNDRGVLELKGTVSGDPDVRDKSTRIILSAKETLMDGGWQDVEGKILVFLPRYPAYSYGDVLHVKGKLETPQQVGDFDYRGYLAHQGIYTTMFYPGVEVLAKGKGSNILAGIYSLRGRLSRALAEILPEPQASLAQGILLGIRGNIPEDLNNDFTRSGAAHLLAISGLNIGIMAGILLGIGVWLFGRKHYLYVWLAFGVIWVYAVITGMNPPVVRGTIMASLFLLAEALGRQRSGMVALTLAAAVMAGISPYILGDASFQLSFLAMAGLIFIYPVFSNFGRRLVAEKLGEEGAATALANLTVDTMSATLGAIIAVWPVVAYYFGIFSLAGPLATFLTMPVLPVVTILGTLAAAIGLASIVIAQILGWVTWPFLTYMILVVRGLAAPSIAAVEVGNISPVFLVCYYTLLAAAILVHSKWQKIRSLASGASGLMKAGVNVTFGLKRNIKWLIVPLIILAALISFTAATMPDDKLRVSFLDVGQGDAILLQKGSTQVLIDGGPSPQAVTLALSRHMPFWDRSIDLVILTHPHQDHLGGLVEVLKRYRVGEVLYPGLDYQSPLYDEFLNYTKEKEIKNTVAISGLQIKMTEGVLINVLNPPENPLTGTRSDVDNGSVALSVKDGKISFLLQGDAMQDTECELIRERAGLAGTVLKVAHHGSATSTTAGFLAVVNPRIVVISCGADNKFGFPDEEVVKRLGEKVGKENVLRTDINGTVDFVTDGERLWVETEK